MNELIGQFLADRYRVDTFLGRGGMAEVYKVWDNQKAVFLAIKVLHEDLAEDKIFLRRFKREAQTLSKLQHPHIVRFYGLERDGDLTFMVMDYVQGTTLRKEIFRSDDALQSERISQVMFSVCSALHYAHQMGLVHCDLKPGNIMTAEHGQVLLTDFGIARMSDSATATMVGLGTPAYMAPEQARGLDPTPQTDIYALGVVLFEMLTGGERPFTGEHANTTGSTSEKVRWEQINLQPPSPRRWNPNISPELEAIVLKCLTKDPVQRFLQPLDLMNALELALPEKKPHQSLETETETFEQQPDEIKQVAELDNPQPPKRKKWWLWASIAIAAALLGGFLWILSRNSKIPEELSVEVESTILVSQTSAFDSKATTLIDDESELALIETLTPSPTPELLSSPTIEVPASSPQTYSTEIPSTPQTNQPFDEQSSMALTKITADNIHSLAEIARITVDGTNNIQWAEDGEVVAISGLNGLQVWDSTFSKQIFTLEGNDINNVNIHSDGQLVVLIRSFERVEIWDISTGELLSAPALEKTNGYFSTLAWSPVENILGFGMYSGDLALYQYESDSLSYIDTDSASISDISWSPDGKFIATASHGPHSIERFFEIWDVYSRIRQRKIQGHDFGSRVSWSPDGTFLAYSSPGFTAVLNTDFWGHTAGLDIGQIAWSPDSSIVGGNIDGNINVWDTTTWQVLATLENQDGPVAFSPDGMQLAIYEDDSIVILGIPSTFTAPGVAATQTETQSPQLNEAASQIVEPISRDNITRLELLTSLDGSFVESIEFDDDEYVLLDNGDITDVWNIQSQEKMGQFVGYLRDKSASQKYFFIDDYPRRYILDTESFNILFEPDEYLGNFHPEVDILVTNKGNECHVWDLASREIQQTLFLAEYSECIFSPDGRYLASYGGQDKKIIIWDYPSGEKLREFEYSMVYVYYSVRAIFSPDSNYIMGKDRNGVEIWDILSGELVYQHNNDAISCNSPRFIQDSSLMYFSCSPESNYITKVYDFDIGYVLENLNNNVVHIDTQNKRLVTAPERNYLGNVEVWDYTSWQNIFTLFVNEDVERVSLNPELLMLTFADNSVSVYDLHTENEIYTFENLGSSFSRAYFSKRGNLIFLSFWNKETLIWGIP